MMKTYIERIVTIILSCLILFASFSSSLSEQKVWNCPCGHTGNKKNYCPRCGHPAPWMHEDSLPQDNLERSYNAAILQLETYLKSSGDNSAKLGEILSAFNELDGYKQSKFLGYYVSVLMKIADEAYNDFALMLNLDMMDKNEEFKSYLKDALNGSSIGSVEKLIEYTNAREAEYKHDDAQAIAQYENCLGFFDASERYRNLIEEKYQKKYDHALDLLAKGDAAGAYFEFASISKFSDCEAYMLSIVNLLGYTPVSPDDSLKPVTDLKIKATQKNTVTLSWTAAPHAKAYDVYYKQSGYSEWIYAGNTENTEITINQLPAKVTCDFRVIPKIGKISADETVLLNQKIITLAVGDYVTFGSYPQTSSGTDKTPIEWLVLEVQENKALLISRYILDCQKYNDKDTIILWENCTLRDWLNNAFLNRAFTAEEQQGILTTLVDNSQKQGGGKFQTKAGNATQDKLFLLSIAEGYRYFPDEEARRCAPTDYAIEQGCTTDKTHYANDRHSGCWWLRSLHKSTINRAGVVFEDGNLYTYHVGSRNYGARPALWIDLDAGIF